MNKPKLVSIVIPCYNDKEYIEESVNSALNQSYQHFEIIIVDDGSDEKTKKVLSNLHHQKIKLITQVNKGLSAARNVGIAHASGDFILTLDADDFFENSFLEKAVPILEKEKNIGVVTCFYNCFINKSKVINRFHPSGGTVEDFLFINNSVGNALFRKQCWFDANGFDENMKNGFEDWEFWISVTKKNWSVFVINEYLFNYRIKEESMFKNTIKHFREKNVEYIFNKHKDVYTIHFQDTINYILKIALRHKNNEKKRLNSIDYKIGKIILFPLRFTKRLFNNK